MFKPAIVATIVFATLALGACSTNGTGTDVPGPTPSPSATTTTTTTSTAPNVTGPQSFGTVTAFKDAIVAAGFPCDPWEPNSEQEKGTCNDDLDVLALLDDAGALSAWVAEYKADPDSTYPVIYGGNWLVMVDSAAELASVTAKMYGTSYTPPPPPEPLATIECDDEAYEITDLSDPETVLRKAWTSKHEECDGTRGDVPFTTREIRALKAAGYDKSREDAGYLYAFCAENEKGDYGQAKEMKGWLVLCPHHPQAKAWKVKIRKLEKEAKLEKSGRSFYAGTYRVGKEVKSGTYAVKGDIENCYWERQDRNGEIIDNNYVRSAKRVQVTIRSSDYSFTSEGCGNWRPAK